MSISTKGRPALRSVSWAPSTIRTAYGVVATVSPRKPTMPELCRRSPAASWFGAYPRRSAIARIRSRVRGLTRAPATPLRTTETVEMDTPAAVATSAIPTLPAMVAPAERFGSGHGLPRATRPRDIDRWNRIAPTSG